MTSGASLEWENPWPGFNWPVSLVQSIDASSERVWDAISMPGNLELCHPFCGENPVEIWPGEGARDVIHYLNGRVYVRQFRRWIERVGYDLEIGKEGGRQSFVSWRIKPQDSESSLLRIAIYPYLLQEIPAAIRWAPHHLYVGPKLKSYLTSVLRGFEWYVIRGEPVPRNQFGVHPWFSTVDYEAIVDEGDHSQPSVIGETE